MMEAWCCSGRHTHTESEIHWTWKDAWWESEQREHNVGLTITQQLEQMWFYIFYYSERSSKQQSAPERTWRKAQIQVEKD